MPASPLPSVFVHMSVDEKTAVVNAAHDHRMSLSEFVRTALREKIERATAGEGKK